MATGASATERTTVSTEFTPRVKLGSAFAVGRLSLGAVAVVDGAYFTNDSSLVVNASANADRKVLSVMELMLTELQCIRLGMSILVDAELFEDHDAN